MGELILIDRISHATAACGVIETVEKQKQEGVVLAEGTRQLAIRLFDCFYYHPDIHTVLRHSPAHAVYQPGDVLPLQSEGFDYPFDFDIAADSGFANIRRGVFTGFGEREMSVPLLDINGIESNKNPPREFGKYRKVTVWETDYEI
jgi:sulfate adenylyltransferase subunit 1